MGQTYRLRESAPLALNDLKPEPKAAPSPRPSPHRMGRGGKAVRRGLWGAAPSCQNARVPLPLPFGRGWGEGFPRRAYRPNARWGAWYAALGTAKSSVLKHELAEATIARVWRGMRKNFVARKG